MNEVKQLIMKQDAVALTHKGKFHADDVFSSALLLYLNPEIEIRRVAQVPEGFEGLVFDIGRGAYDHHQKDSRIRENGVPFAAFGLLWEALGADILGAELATRFDEEVVQPLDLNDNTGEKNELASLIGDFNPSWDVEGDVDVAFFEAVRFASMILDNKFAKFLGNERADQQVEQMLREQMEDQKQKALLEDAKILVMDQFVPCQKKLSATDIAFIIFPSNRGGYCIQPLKKAGSMNYKCNFPDSWLGLEGQPLVDATGLKSANFCHKGGFIMTVNEEEDAIKACLMSQKKYVPQSIITFVTDQKEDQISSEKKACLQNISIPGLEGTEVKKLFLTDDIPMVTDGEIRNVDMDKNEWKDHQKGILKSVLRDKPECVIVDGSMLFAYPLIHLLRKKKVSVYTFIRQEDGIKLVRIPSGS